MPLWEAVQAQVEHGLARERLGSLLKDLSDIVSISPKAHVYINFNESCGVPVACESEVTWKSKSPEVMLMNEDSKIMPTYEKPDLALPHRTQLMLKGCVPPPPIAESIGFKLVTMGSGKAVIELEADERHANPMGLFMEESCAT